MHALVAFALTVAPIVARADGDETPQLIDDASRSVSAVLGATARTLRIASKVLGQTRRIDVVLPRSFAASAASRRYPVVVVLDGESNLAPSAAVVDELARNGQIPESIVVAIENTDALDGRVHDLTPPGLSVSGSSLDEGGERFLDFIEKELLPAVERQFRGGLPRALVGHSSGGILATYAAATRPSFRVIVAIDAPIHLGDNWLAKKLAARAAADPSPLRFAYYSARFPWPADAWKSLVSAAPKSWSLHNEALALEGHETVVMLATYLGLRETFDDYSRLAAPQAPSTSVVPYYTSVSARLGATLVPPQRVLRDLVDDFLSEGRGAAAREAYGALVVGYGAPVDGAALLAQIADVERLPPPTESVEQFLATPFPTPDEARAYVGKWVGDLWMNSDEPRTGHFELRIRVVDGRVVGETVHHGTPSGDLVQTWQYMRVTPTGLSFGYVNGMRPRGLALFEGTLDRDALSGTQRIAGVATKSPDGSVMPRLQFRVTRAKR